MKSINDAALRTVASRVRKEKTPRYLKGTLALRQTMSNTDTIDPALWGKSFWDTLHYAAAGFPAFPTEERKESATKFFSTFAEVLPCNECRDHATAYVKAKPPTVSSKDALLKWTLDFHNAVNIKLGMPQMSLAAVRVKYLPRASLTTPVAAPKNTVAVPAPPVAAAPRNPVAPPVTPVAAAPRNPVAAPRAPVANPTAVVRRAPQPAARAMGLNSQTGYSKTTRGPIVAARNGTNTATRDPVVRPRAGTTRGPRPARKKCGCGG